MKTLFLSIYIFFIVNTIIAQQYGEKVTTHKGDTECSSIIDSKCDPKTAIIWNDTRLSTVAGREEIIRIAATRAFEKLANVGENSHIIKLYNHSQVGIWELLNDPSRNAQWWLHKPVLQNYRRTVQITASFQPFSRTINVAARVQPVIKFLTSPYTSQNVPHQYNRGGIVEGFCGEFQESKIYKMRGRSTDEYFNYYNAVGWSDRTDCKTCYACMREELSAVIEIFPEIFLRKKFCIPNLNRWAKTPEEAVEFLILHELGHVEAYISKKSKYELYAHRRLSEQSNDEDSAWEFAINIFYYEKINR